MKPPAQEPQKTLSLLDLLQYAQSPQPVQVITLTIDNTRVLCLGPVVHAPPLGIQVKDVQEIEFGEIIPAKLAIELLSGDFRGGKELQ